MSKPSPSLAAIAGSLRIMEAMPKLPSGYEVSTRTLEELRKMLPVRQTAGLPEFGGVSLFINDDLALGEFRERKPQ